tara:strand:- start:495 stop:1097 length:603 start_codon:yes stop_codon:yes gene_type:complete
MIINESTKFIHIPRTAGRFLFLLFKKNNRIDNYNFTRLYKGIEFPHLNSLQSNSVYPVSKMFDTFTVIRNPVNKFMASIGKTNTLNNKAVSYMFENEINFFNIVHKLREQTSTNNTFEPQINFVEKDTKIWKYEEGFKENFYNWIKNNFKINIDLEDLLENKIEKVGEKEQIKCNININEKQKQYIKNYYFLDYKIFNYK